MVYAAIWHWDARGWTPLVPTTRRVFGSMTGPSSAEAVASPLVVYEPVEVVSSAAVVEREP
jgi:hypothetical protein